MSRLIGAAMFWLVLSRPGEARLGGFIGITLNAMNLLRLEGHVLRQVAFLPKPMNYNVFPRASLLVSCRAPIQTTCILIGAGKRASERPGPLFGKAA
jgi:hypothetical protein